MSSGHRRHIPVQWLVVLGMALAGGGALAVRAATDEPPVPQKSTMLTEHDADRIRRALEKLSANQEQILAALEEIEAELQIVKVRVTR